MRQMSWVSALSLESLAISVRWVANSRMVEASGRTLKYSGVNSR
jgi:hypothetical protein